HRQRQQQQGAGFAQPAFQLIAEACLGLLPCVRAARHPGCPFLRDQGQSIPCSAGCTSLPPSMLMPTRRCTYGRIAAEIATDEVCGTAPGMLVTQKWVTP